MGIVVTVLVLWALVLAVYGLLRLLGLEER